MPPYKINHVNKLHSLAKNFDRNVEEEMVEEPANVIYGDNMITPSLPNLSKEPATPLFDRQLENRRHTFSSPVADESSDNRQLILRLEVQLYLLF